MSAPKFGLDDAAIRRMATKFETAATPVAVFEPNLRFASYASAVENLERSGFERLGSAFYKQGHALWQLSKASDGYSLVRVAAEPEVFEEDKVKEAPGLHEHEQLKMGSRDRYGVPIQLGALVHYSLGGEPAVGRVVRAAYGYLDVRLNDQVDSGVPSDLVMVDRRAAVDENLSLGIERDSPEHEVDSGDKEQMNMHLNPEKVAAFVEQHFCSFGATLVDAFEQTVPRTLVAKVNKLAQEAKACETCTGKGCEKCMGRQATRIASWESLQQFAAKPVLRAIVDAVQAGARARQASKVANIPFALAYELRDAIAAVPAHEARAILATAKNVRTATLDDAAYGELVGRLGADRALHLASCVLDCRNKKLAFQRVAVDQTAEDYWTAYFGDYGEQWVREIKRRVKADFVRVALLKQGVDQTAAEYWSNYFGDYGDKLVDEVDRSTKSKKDVTAAVKRPMGTSPMLLPQSVPRRDIFVGANIIAEESWEGNRVAIAKAASGAFQVLIRSGNAQKVEVLPSQREAVAAFRKAVYAHCGY
jgi:hypothetical protein